jgi:hypothetical protein
MYIVIMFGNMVENMWLSILIIISVPSVRWVSLFWMVVQLVATLHQRNWSQPMSHKVTWLLAFVMRDEVQNCEETSLCLLRWCWERYALSWSHLYQWSWHSLCLLHQRQMGWCGVLEPWLATGNHLCMYLLLNVRLCLLLCSVFACADHSIKLIVGILQWYLCWRYSKTGFLCRAWRIVLC